MKKVKMFILSAVALLSFAPVLVPSVAMAQTAKDSICQGAGLAGGGSTDCSAGSGPTVDKVIAAAINLISIVVGVIAVIMIIIGGLKYITSAGEGAAITSAKNTIIYAIIGLVVVAFAQVIVKFVLTKV